MLVWLEVVWPNPVLTIIFDIIELARLIAHLLLFFFFWWHWVSALPPVSVFAGLALLLLETLTFNFQAWAELAKGLSELGLAFILSECEHCWEDWTACVGHYAGVILGLWWLNLTDFN